MQAPAQTPNENARLAALRALHLLDTEPEERFDRLTRLAKRLFNVPIALVSLVDADRQWFKSCVGLPEGMTETPRDVSFCAHAILDNDILSIPDTFADPRFSDNPLVIGEPKIRFYAGCPLSVTNGSKIGTLCLIDTVPREFDDDERALLRDLASMAEQEIAAVRLATLDELTLISNRRGFVALAQHAVHLCHRLERPATLFFFDLDGFKQINDKFGHAEGDRALIDFSGILRGMFRESDVIGRLGGDEFVVLLTNTDASQGAAILERLTQAVAENNEAAQRGYEIAFSVGAVHYDATRHSSINEMLRDADALMYRSKQARRASA